MKNLEEELKILLSKIDEMGSNKIMTEREQEIRVSLHADKMLRQALDMKENNKLIAEFMGQEFEASSKEWEINRCFNNGQIEKPFVERLDYHESWDSLMPVANEIIKSRDEQNADWDLTDLKYALCTTNIELVYQAVVEFINQLNNNNE